MDLDWIIRELHEERRRVERLISAFEDRGAGRITGKAPSGRRGRKFMDAAARQEVSERMRQYWAKRRQETGREA